MQDKKGKSSGVPERWEMILFQENMMYMYIISIPPKLDRSYS